jgi:hypothetical protein
VRKKTRENQKAVAYYYWGLVAMQMSSHLSEAHCIERLFLASVIGSRLSAAGWRFLNCLLGSLACLCSFQCVASAPLRHELH